MSKLPATMHAVEIKEFGPAEGLVLAERPVPIPNDGEVLIRVSYAGVNRPDVQQRLGGYPPPPGASDIPGLEIAGEIVSAAQNANHWKTGDKVCALVSGGGYAEYCTAPALQCLPIPNGFSLEEGASIVETTYTVWANVFMRGKLKENETLLIHGGSSGIGTTAIQMAKCFGARIVITAGSDEKCDVCLDLGADRTINYNKENFVEIFSMKFLLVIAISVPSAILADYFSLPLAWFLGPMLATSIGALVGLKIVIPKTQSIEKKNTLKKCVKNIRQKMT